jgi:hypothetical protein
VLGQPAHAHQPLREQHVHQGEEQVARRRPAGWRRGAWPPSPCASVADRRR